MYAWQSHLKEYKTRKITTQTSVNVKHLHFAVEIIRELILGREIDKAAAILSTIVHEFGDLAEMCVNVREYFYIKLQPPTNKKKNSGCV